MTKIGMKKDPAKRYYMKRSGKQTKINMDANKILKQMFLDKGITRCELCGSTFMLSFAHRHKRIHYRSHPELLSDYKQVLVLCMADHMKLEASKSLTEDTFNRLRGEE